MTNLSREFCFKIRDARRSEGISQSELAREVGCNQSAISMFEKGDGTKLNDETVEKLSKRYNVPIPKPGEEQGASRHVAEVAGASTGTAQHLERGFCPNSSCPSNTRYEVDGRGFALPHREQCDPAGGKYCVLCGEVLEKRCPNCGAHLHEGAVCTWCGQAYIVV